MNLKQLFIETLIQPHIKSHTILTKYNNFYLIISHMSEKICCLHRNEKLNDFFNQRKALKNLFLKMFTCGEIRSLNTYHIIAFPLYYI